MLLISILILLLLITVFVISPLILLGCGKLYKAKKISFQNALLTGIIILIMGVMFELFSIAFHIENILINLSFTILSFAIAIWVIKKRFDTNILRALGIYLTSIIFTIIISVVIALSIRTFVVQAFKIPSGAMLETIQIGDHLLVNKLIYKFKPPERGDIIVFKYPVDPNKDFIKRIVGVGGDSIEIKDKEVYINNMLIEERYVIHGDSRMLSSDISPRDNFGPVTIPNNSYFVMGDNRDNSLDSRFWGFVDSKYIKGKAFIIYWSLDKEKGTIRLERIGKPL